MWFKHRAWIPIAWGLSVINVAAVWFAAAPGEPLHATIHAALGVGFALGARRLAARREVVTRQDMLHESLDRNEELELSVGDLQGRLVELEERLDFTERLLAQRDAERIGKAP